jgi:hypothetical protein
MEMRRLIELVDESVLNELQGYRDGTLGDVQDVLTGSEKNHEALVSFQNFLRQKGFKVIHSGGFGVVFSRPDLNYVIKVFLDDPAYLKFIQFCFGSSDPHLPRFRGKLIPILKGRIHAVRMEHLNPCDQSLGNVIENLGEFAVSHFDPESFLAYCYQYGNPNQATMLEKQQGVLQTLDRLRSLETKDIRFDLKPDNFMMRGNVLVITDPFYSYSAWMRGIA